MFDKISSSDKVIITVIIVFIGGVNLMQNILSISMLQDGDLSALVPLGVCNAMFIGIVFIGYYATKYGSGPDDDVDTT
jgi:hypothetical protein